MKQETTPTIPGYEAIATRAYALWEQQGRPEGRDIEIWSEAETQLRSAAPAAAATVPREEAPAATHSAPAPARTTPANSARRSTKP